MLVSYNQLENVIEEVRASQYKSTDTETTGLRPYCGDKLFSIIMSVPGKNFYFNFNPYPGLDPKFILNRECIAIRLKHCYRKTDTIFFHNAKFDLAFLHKEGLLPLGEFHDTQVGARIEYNQHIKYDLDICAARIGLAKSDAVEKYIKEHKLWEWQTIPGKKGRKKNKWYDRVPLEVMQPYGEMDGEVTLKLGLHQIKALKELSDKVWTTAPAKPAQLDVFKLEKKLTPVCFDIEKRGILLDRNYVEKALEFETNRYREAADKFQVEYNQKLVDSNKVLSQFFKDLGITIKERTAKGQISVSDQALSEISHPSAGVISEYRDAYKRANTYYQGFLYWADPDNIVHFNLRQSGTATGRFSASDPNLQNLTAEDESPFPIRRSFIPRWEYFFVSIDYDAMEFKLMLDYAGEHGLIEKIKQGLDPHEATVELIREKTGKIITRKQAKTLNFGLLYGMGREKLAKTLGITEEEAIRLKITYFEGLPAVYQFLYSSRAAAEIRDIYGLSGRCFSFPDKRFAYKAANCIIQGGCADIIKKAMVNIGGILEGARTAMVAQVHDELLFEVHFKEVDLIEPVKKAMEEAYRPNYLPLTCSASHSLKSWHDLKEGLDFGAEARNKFQDQSAKAFESHTPSLGSQNQPSINSWNS